MSHALPTSTRTVTRRPRRDERGAVMILGALGLLVALVASALAVDLGRQALMKKDDQRIADLAALDAVRELQPYVLQLPGITLAVATNSAKDAAKASALRNGFDPDAGGNSLVTEVGTMGTSGFTPGGTAVDTVRVTVTSTLGYLFAPGGRSLTARALARTSSGGSPGNSNGPTAAFDIGSALASATVANAPLLNSIVGQMIQGNADVVSWNGLGNADVTLEAVQQQLLAQGLDVGTPEKLMATNLTMEQLFEASADALDQQGDSRAAIFRGGSGIVAQANNTNTFKLADMISFDQGLGDKVLDTNMNVRNMVVGAAEVANGSNVITVPNAGVTIPGVTSTALALKIVEPRQMARGAVGTIAKTSQVELTITPTLNITDPIAGLVAPKITGAFPFKVSGAGAEGKLTDIDCDAPDITIGGDTKPLSGAGSATLRVSATLPLVGSIPLMDVNTVGTTATIAGVHADLPFAHDSEFHPTWGGSKQVRGSALDLTSKTAFTTPNWTVLSALPVPANVVTDAVKLKLPTVLGNLETNVITPLLNNLGLTIGVADIQAYGLYDCDAAVIPTPSTVPHPILVG